MFSRGDKLQPPRYGMTEGEFKDLLNVADYSKAKVFKVDDIKSTAYLKASVTVDISLRLGDMCSRTARHLS